MIPSSGVLADTVSVSCLQGSRKVIWSIEPDSCEPTTCRSIRENCPSFRLTVSSSVG